ncbi:putative Atrial natriuretic peptide receptor 1 [Hypsibius exemplaris]|uniref:Atrial natriuretic peptide receptor 1 n=1 Tax=Hypsibius exemplaris TaxID=2072580 RepID=A0A1W0W8V0_HYPEX|nr:putative Atrial natriuretic peptide receptor 1 [Hypsibius exemplaris]
MTLLVYGLKGQRYLQGLAYTAAGFDFGVRDATNRFAGRFNLPLVYVSSDSILLCEDTAAYFDRVSRYYYGDLLPRGGNSSLAVIYPGCDESKTLAQFGKEWNVPVISTGTTFSNLRDRALFPTTVALGPIQYEIYGVFLLRLFAKFNWTSVSLIYDVSGRVAFNQIVSARIQGYVRRNGPDVQLHVFPLDCSAGKQDDVDYVTVLTAVSRVSRIILISVPHPITRNFLINSSKMGWKLGETVWISLDASQGPWGSLAWQFNDSNDGIALTAFRSVFKLEFCARQPTPEFRTFSAELRTRSERNYNVSFPPSSSGPSEFVITAYSAVLALAQVLNESLNDEGIFESGNEIARRFLSRTFYDPVVGDLYVDSAGERQRPMCLMDFDFTVREFQEVLSYTRGKSKDDDIGSVNNRTIDWATLDGKPLSNEPVCGFNEEKPSCKAQGKPRCSFIVS